MSIKVLLLADTHVGFDLPRRPRIKRPRRGEDFYRNFQLALAPALRGEVDLVVHGGDLLFRSRVPAGLVQLALEPLFRVADAGVPVMLVPGNHERSRIPRPLLAGHPGLHIFDRPRTFQFSIRGLRVALSGFPYHPTVRRDFDALLAAADPSEDDHIRLICMHQAVEGARVGAHDFTFRSAPDVLAGARIPRGWAALLSGHIHRGQVLRRDLAGRALAAPVIYPGAVERTSFTEREELKGYYLLELIPDSAPGGYLKDLRFVELPTRPMLDLRVEATPGGAAGFSRWLSTRLAASPPRSIVRIRYPASLPEDLRRVLSLPRLRALAPQDRIVGASPEGRESRSASVKELPS